MTFRVGQGYDVHRLVTGRALILGGVKIPSERGLLGHSDADALVHAICDALLGAAALGDIGQHFPDTDPRFAGANSRDLLRATVTRVHEAGFRLSNVDATIIAQRPKLSPYVADMAKNLAEDLGVTISQVNIKAKTNEGIGHLGRGEGIAVHAIALLEHG